MNEKGLIFIPTYNERDNVKEIVQQIKSLGLNLDILILDDNSPDGTGEIIDALAENDDKIFVKHRGGKEGVGSAHLEGIRFAYERGYHILITMDCDFTHDPNVIPGFLANADQFEVVVGSRFMNNESLADWNLYRKLMTHVGHMLTHRLLKIPFDATGAFRLYRIDKIKQDLFKRVKSKSYSFFLTVKM